LATERAAATKRQRIEISGAVQGVGFRPWVYRLANEFGLAGAVWNADAGLVVEVEGPEAAVRGFAERLERQPPPLARVDSLRHEAVAPRGERGFVIAASEAAGEAGAAAARVAPDTAPCAACRADYLSPGNRRHGYAFTNCTHCGPRYTIVRSLPYDRPYTTLADFQLCADCRWEYEAASDRRFHAQPNACPECGPRLGASLSWAGRLLAGGGILAVKNVGGYQLACDAAQAAPLERLRRWKQRGRKPFALLARDLTAAARICRLEASEARALQDPARPIVLLARQPQALARVAAAVAPDQPRLGVMLPSSPLHELLLAASGRELLVMTSGNHGGEPLAAEADEARQALGGVADGFLDHNRPIAARVDDSVAECWRGEVRLLRRARGYVPEPIELGAGDGAVWAAGAELKNTFCLTRGGQAFLSPHIGDMENLECWQVYRQTFKHYLKLLGVRPQRLVLDLHPGYQLHRWALELGQELGITQVVRVQHHHAHVAACLAEHGLQRPVWGVAWDGTGYGSDGTIWGGEVLWAGRRSFERAAHWRPVRLAGGEQAVRHPWRAAMGFLQRAVGAERAAALAREWWPGLGARRVALEQQLLQRPRLGWMTSSVGRLFDAAAAVAGVVDEHWTASFEGEAAMALENAAGEGGDAPAYPHRLIEGNPLQIDPAPLLAALAADRQRGERIETMARRFHAGVAAAGVAALVRLRAAAGEERAAAAVCLIGGVFQNRRLLSALAAGLESEGFRVLVPRRVPGNDGGLALGQAAVALAQAEGGAEGG
jgi:hydrogenase maturation protein HypF